MRKRHQYQIILQGENDWKNTELTQGVISQLQSVERQKGGSAERGKPPMQASLCQVPMGAEETEACLMQKLSQEALVERLHMFPFACQI